MKLKVYFISNKKFISIPSLLHRKWIVPFSFYLPPSPSVEWISFLSKNYLSLGYSSLKSRDIRGVHSRRARILAAISLPCHFPLQVSPLGLKYMRKKSSLFTNFAYFPIFLFFFPSFPPGVYIMHNTIVVMGGGGRWPLGKKMKILHLCKPGKKMIIKGGE